MNNFDTLRLFKVFSTLLKYFACECFLDNNVTEFFTLFIYSSPSQNFGFGLSSLKTHFSKILTSIISINLSYDTIFFTAHFLQNFGLCFMWFFTIFINFWPPKMFASSILKRKMYWIFDKGFRQFWIRFGKNRKRSNLITMRGVRRKRI